MRAGLAVVLAVLLHPPCALGQDAVSADAFLKMGIEQLADGDFEAAVFSLDTAVRRYQTMPAAAEPLVRAYVYLGAAYVGLGHTEAAKGKFREALSRDPHVRLRPEEFAPNVIKVFEAQLMKMTAARKKRSGTILLALGSAGAAGAVAVAALASGSGAPANRAPSAGIEYTPGGQAIAGVTVMTFTAVAPDPDGDVLTYHWSFGDGEQSSGPLATHRFAASGTFRVTLTVDDGRGGTASAEVSVVSRTLAGRWVSGRWTYTLVQNGSVLLGTLSDQFDRFDVTGTVTPPRTVSWIASPENGGITIDYRFTGIANDALDRISGAQRDENFRTTADLVLVRQ